MFDDLFEDLIHKKKTPEIKPEGPSDSPFGDYFDTGMGDQTNDIWSSGELPDYWSTKK